MLVERDYKVAIKEYIDANVSSNNMYSYLNNNEISLLRAYYEAYTVELFRRLRGGLRLEVSESKAKKLVALKGSGNWEFAGMVDKGKVGAEHCELGHALRYCYYARNVENGSLLKFGNRCVGDFFDLDTKGVAALTKLKDTMLKEIKEVIAIKQLRLTEEHLAYDMGAYGRLIKKIGLNNISSLNSNKRLLIAQRFLSIKLPLPASLCDFLNEDSLMTNIVTPELLGLDGFVTLRESPITFISEGAKSICELEVLRVINPKDAKYKSSSIAKHLDLYNVSKWLGRVKLLEDANAFYKSRGVEDWGLMGSKIDSYLKNKDLVNKDKLKYSVNMLNAFSDEATVRSYSLNNGLCLPYKINGVEVYKKSVSKIDYWLAHLKDDDIVEGIDGLVSYIADLGSKKLKEATIVSYMVSNVSKSMYKGVQGIDIAKDIVVRQGKQLNTMTAKQKTLVLRVYDDMVAIDKSTKVNNKYKLEDKPGVVYKIDLIKSNKDRLNLNDFQLGLLNTVCSSQTVSDKQLVYIDDMYKKAKALDKQEETAKSNKANKVYSLDERNDIKLKLTQLVNSEAFKGMPDTVKNIVHTVLTQGHCSDKQLYYIDKAYNKLPLDVKNNVTNERHYLKDREDLRKLVNSLKNKNIEDDKTRNILNNVIEYGTVTDKQLKYLNIAYMNLIMGV